MASKVPEGSSSGTFNYQSSITYPHKTEKRDCRLEIKLHGYSDQQNTLRVGAVYAVAGRWIVRSAAEHPEAPTLHFDRNFAFELGLAQNLKLAPGIRHFVAGFGQVQWRTEVADPHSAGHHNNLVFIMNHADYDRSVS
jgi:hypothetical protein